MTVNYSVNDLVPHSGLMSLLDEITGYGDNWLSATVRITPSSMFVDSSGVPAWIGLEYLAQAIGAFAGLEERRVGRSPKLGFLLGTRKYECSTDYFELGDILEIRVERNLQAENGLSAFDCQLTSERYSASASLNVYQPEDAQKFLEEARK